MKRNLVVADLNGELISAVIEAGIEARHGDYFREAWKIQRPVLMTASNPMWTFGGGIDAAFEEHFPILVNYKRLKGGPQERLLNICFTMTVDNRLRATQETIYEALKFALSQTADDETLVVSGVGTGIGGMSVEEFVEVLKAVIAE